MSLPTSLASRPFLSDEFRSFALTGMPFPPPSPLAAIKSLPLINRGRLSVQPVPDTGYEVIVRLGEEGGWSEEVATGKKAKTKVAKKEEEVHGTEAAAKSPAGAKKRKQPPKASTSSVVKADGVKEEEGNENGVSEQPPLQRRKSTRTK